MLIILPAFAVHGISSKKNWSLRQPKGAAQSWPNEMILNEGRQSSSILGKCQVIIMTWWLLKDLKVWIGLGPLKVMV
jgi:hypothetical protein